MYVFSIQMRLKRQQAETCLANNIHLILNIVYFLLHMLGFILGAVQTPPYTILCTVYVSVYTYGVPLIDSIQPFRVNK